MKKIVLLLFLLLLSATPCPLTANLYAQDETVTLLTYYPAPYGVYKQITVTHDGTAKDFVVDSNGNVAIGGTIPNSYSLHVGSGGVSNSTTFGSPYIVVGGGEGTQQLGTIHSIGFGYGYTTDHVWKTPVEIGSVIEDLNGHCKSGLVFATRDTTNNVAPTERVRISNTGNVGIGVTAPTGKLHMTSNEIASNSTDDDADGRVDELDDVMIFTTTGEVGLGTTTPPDKLSLVFNNLGAGNALSISNYGTIPGANIFMRNARGTSSSPTATGINDRLAFLSFSGHNGTDFSTAGYIVVEQDAAISGGRVLGRYVFYLNTPTTTNKEVLRIAGEGNVGIATNTPKAKLEVGGTFRSTSSTSVPDGSGPGIEIYYNSGSGAGTINAYDRSGSYKKLELYGNPTTINESMSGSGNVGIGVSNPTARLDVAGNIKAALSNSLAFGGTTYWMLYNSSSKEIGYDVAELFETNEEVEPGDLLVVDSNGKLRKSNKPNDTKIAGIVSSTPAIVFEGNELQIAPKPFEFKKGFKPPITLAGRVICNVLCENGPIEPGDLLTTSPNPGYAMKAQPINIGGIEIYRPGTIVGKALEPLKEGKGKILVLVCLM